MSSKHMHKEETVISDTSLNEEGIKTDKDEGECTCKNKSEETGGESYDAEEGNNKYIQALREELVSKTKEAVENFDKFIRLKAEFENYKKRINKEHSELSKYATERLVRDIIVVVDNMERALLSANGTHGNLDALKKGIEITCQSLLSILKGAGLIEIESINKPFNPHEHEALSQVESADMEDNIVVNEFEKGYYFKDRVLRHSKVAVSKKSVSDTNKE